MKISERVKSIKPSATVNMADRVKRMEREGKTIIHFELGEPDFDTPLPIKEAAKKALDKGLTHYTSSSGIFELKDVITKNLRKDKLDYGSDEILITPGCKQSLLYIFLATINPGEEVIILDPSWSTFSTAVKLAQGLPVRIKTDENFLPDIDLIKKRVTKKTKLLIINSPNNPTGAVYDKKILEDIADIVVDNDVFVISDEIYKDLVYDVKHTSFASLNGMKKRTILVNGFSKSYAMTGWRLGFTCAPADLIKEMIKLQQSSVTCVTSFVQYGAIAAFNCSDHITTMVNEYKRRRDVLLDGLKELKGVKSVKPNGAFYVFPDFSSCLNDSKEFSNKLLEEKYVAVTPGTPFGKDYKNHLRISYSTNVEQIKEGIKRIKELI